MSRCASNWLENAPRQDSHHSSPDSLLLEMEKRNLIFYLKGLDFWHNNFSTIHLIKSWILPQGRRASALSFRAAGLLGF